MSDTEALNCKTERLFCWTFDLKMIEYQLFIPYKGSNLEKHFALFQTEKDIHNWLFQLSKTSTYIKHPSLGIKLTVSMHPHTLASTTQIHHIIVLGPNPTISQDHGIGDKP